MWGRKSPFEQFKKFLARTTDPLQYRTLTDCEADGERMLNDGNLHTFFLCHSTREDENIYLRVVRIHKCHVELCALTTTARQHSAHVLLRNDLKLK